MADFSQPETQLYIDGAFRDARGGRVFENINPATEEVFGTCADATVEDMQDAIAAAHRAFEQTAWATDVALRKRVLQQLRDGLEQEKEHLRLHTVSEVGCPIQLTYGPQMDSVLGDMQWVIDLLDSYAFESELGVHEFFGMKSRRRVFREPVGVVACISPWNFPIQVTWAKTIPALAAGNTVVLKPAPDTPYHATFLARVAAEYTDIPAGVLNVVTAGDPAEVGEVLTSDPRVDMVSFTGSTGVGRRIMANASDTVKKVFLELGGKSVNLILDDADFAEVLPGTATVCMHGGQGCAMTTRLLLPRSRYAEAIEIVKATFEAVPYGDPMDPQNIQGPQVNKRQQERILGYCKLGVEEGATLLVGGKRPEQFEKGFYVQPTLFGDVDNAMRIAQEEIFGPVLVAIPYDDDDDAVRIANDSIYGLSGAISSGDEERAVSVARRIRTGTLGINGGMWFGPDAPFGGYRQSGVGREMGIAGFEEYLETKTIGLKA